MLHREDKDHAIKAKYELDVVMNHEDVDRRMAQVPNAFVIPDEVINRLSMPHGISGRQKLAITTTGSASAIEEAVDYGRSQMALYDRVPLFQYCDEMPNQVGNAKIPIWTAGPTVGDGTAEGTQTALSTPTLTALELTPQAFDSQVEITNIADLQTGMWLSDAVRQHMIPFIDQEVVKHALTDSTDGIVGVNGNRSGIKTITSGAASWSKMVEMESEIDAALAMDFGRRAYLLGTALWGRLKTIDKATGAGRFVLDVDPWGFHPGGVSINGYPALRTTLLGAGGTNDAVFTDWFGNMKIPSWSGYEFSLDNITNALKPRITMYKFCRPKATSGRQATVAYFRHS